MSFVSAALSETGYTSKSQPFIRLWGARAVYVGHAFDLSAHRNAVGVLAVGLYEAFGVARDPHDPGCEYRWCRTAVIKPNALHHLRTSNVPIAFIYLDALSADLRSLLAACRVDAPLVGYELKNEGRIIELLLPLVSDSSVWRNVREPLGELLEFRPTEAAEPRIAKALMRLNEAPGEPVGLAMLAAEARLSPSRFQHLFKETTGVPLRRYRTWCRMGAALQRATEGASLTDAALAAGFSSSAHFSAAFRDMFGLMPSALGLQKAQIIEAK